MNTYHFLSAKNRRWKCQEPQENQEETRNNPLFAMLLHFGKTYKLTNEDVRNKSQQNVCCGVNS